MGLKPENVLTGIIIFSVLISLTFGIYGWFSDEYTITPDYVDAEGRSIIEALNDINVISGFVEIQNVITALFDRSDTTGSEYDILGTLRAGGIGTVKIFTGVITAPLEIIEVIANPDDGFYTIPSSVYIALGLIIIIYIGWMILSELLGK